MTQPLSPEELGELFKEIDDEPTGKLSELAKVAGLSLAEDYIGADLSSEDLSGDNLSGANLSNSNLSNSNLTEANLTGANLEGANLTGANLEGANLTGACIENLQINSETIFQQVNCDYIFFKSLENDQNQQNVFYQGYYQLENKLLKPINLEKSVENLPETKKLQKLIAEYNKQNLSFQEIATQRILITNFDTVFVSPVRTIIRREEEITLIRKVRKVRKVEVRKVRKDFCKDKTNTAFPVYGVLIEKLL